jgi:tetratricopeptide (TPR) repeat protein
MTATAPRLREQMADRVTGCIEAGDLRQALEACQELNRHHPDYSYGWYLASWVLRRTRRWPDALRTIERALQLDPADRFRLHRARCLLESGDMAGAVAAASELRGRPLADAALHGELGTLLYRVGNHAGALEHYSAAIDLDHGSGELYFNRAAVRRYLGDAAGAEQDFDAAIALRPDEYEAYNGRAQLRRQTAARNHVAELRDTISRTRTPAGLVQLHYALAKELEDLEQYAAAFASLRQGAALKRSLMRYDVATDLGIIDRIREVYAAERFDGQYAGFDDAGAIFVIGMPRTGTTLVERILGSHPDVCAAGELNEFGLELTRQVATQAAGHPQSRLEFVDATTRLDFKVLGQRYLERVRPLRDDRPVFIDKLPFNYLYAGLIHLALPRAKIVSVRRNPLDTCFSVYKQLFKDAYPFSYDLTELGRYFIAYDRLMRHWDAVMPGVVLTVQYEDVVADVRGQAQRLLQHCSLSWDERCVRFHENTSASTTASALQVRQPLYDTSIGRWRHYAVQLEPLRLQLTAAGIVCDR